MLMYVTFNTGEIPIVWRLNILNALFEIHPSVRMLRPDPRLLAIRA